MPDGIVTGCGAGALAASELEAGEEPPAEDAGCAADALAPPLVLFELLPLLEHPLKISAQARAAAAPNDEYQERLNGHLRIVDSSLLGCIQE